MGRNQILALTLCSLAGVGYVNTSATAGWFGPSNYNECVLDTMKGQNAYMIEFAQAFCRKQLPLPPPPTSASPPPRPTSASPPPRPTSASPPPASPPAPLRPPPEPVLLNSELIKSVPCTGSFETTICIRERPDNYTISLAIGYFMNKSPCDINFSYDRFTTDQSEYLRSTTLGLRLMGLKSIDYDGKTERYAFDISHSSFNCFGIEYYGFSN
jgi:hypothetical protein